MNATPATLVLLLALSAALSRLIGGRVLAYLRHRAILDHPNERSSHVLPTPRGGGWGVMLTVLPLWAAIGWVGGEMARLAPVLAGAVALMAVSWIDDRRGLGPGPRFLVQIAAVALGLSALPSDTLIAQGWLPWELDRLAAGFAWLWFVNLFNFMDGIDGIAGSEAAVVALGLALMAGPFGLGPAFALFATALAGAALGFLFWNWHPAKVFMGDVGSVPLGYLLGWLLFQLAGQGGWAAALILPLVFLADATITLARRAALREKIWQAHRQHFYQRAVQGGRSHARVVLAMLVANLVLMALAWVSPDFGWAAVAGAGVAVAALFALWARPLDSRR